MDKIIKHMKDLDNIIALIREQYEILLKQLLDKDIIESKLKKELKLYRKQLNYPFFVDDLDKYIGPLKVEYDKVNLIINEIYDDIEDKYINNIIMIRIVNQ